MDPELTILMVDDDTADTIRTRHTLEKDGLSFAWHTASCESELRQALATFEPDVILYDCHLAGLETDSALAMMRRMCPSTPVLMISGSIEEETAATCRIGQRATDYLLKSNLNRLAPAVRRAARERRNRADYEQRIERLSHYDPLTGLPNLARVSDLAEQALTRARAHHGKVAVVTLNLDRFRLICERFGRHRASDVIKQIGAVLQSRCLQQEFLARVGADEFLMVIPDVASSADAAVQVSAILDDIEQPLKLLGTDVRVTASAGIALFPGDGGSFELLLDAADMAMHESKALGPGGFQCHSGDVVKHAQEMRGMENGLREAIHAGELTMQFQPQFELRDGRICGVEALARWRRADGSSIPAATFIPLAEQTGLIHDLGRWALRASCQAAVDWPQHCDTRPIVCVNVSTQQISDEFTADVIDALAVSGLPPHLLELEITESVLITNTNFVLACVAEWKRLGVRVAVDDFGTGYSGLSYLARLPVDRLKIDRCLVQGLLPQWKETAVVRAILGLGRDLGFTVLAEGVETEAQLELLYELGCQQAQGYFLGPPVSLLAEEHFTARRWPVHRRAMRE